MSKNIVLQAIQVGGVFMKAAVGTVLHVTGLSGCFQQLSFSEERPVVLRDVQVPRWSDAEKRSWHKKRI